MKDFIVEAIMDLIDRYLTDDMMDAVKVKIVEYLRSQAALSATPLDDYAVDKLAEFLEVEA